VAARRRLDAELLRRDLVSSRTEAQSLIAADRVLVNGSVATKPARQVAPGDAIVVSGPPAKFVGRGAEKLDHALDEFGLDVTGVRALDAGASTGGFTDCLLQRGARQVVALDVGHGQLHERLRADPRVVNLERTNVRHADLDTIGGPVDLVVGDLSFISLRLVIPVLVSMCQPRAPMVLLVKPQFEVGREQVGKGGVVREDALREAAVDRVAYVAAGLGRRERGRVESAVPGPKGNREIFLWLSARNVEERSGVEEAIRTATLPDRSEEEIR